MPDFPALPGTKTRRQANVFVALTKSDSTIYEDNPALYVGTTGNVSVVDALGVTTLFKNVPSGTFMPIQIRKLMSTNTTASDIIGLY